MRLNFLNMSITVVCLLFVPFAVCAENINVQSRIKSVIIYPDGAQVTRGFETDIGVGSSVLILSDLPSTIDPTSVRLEGAGNGKLNIISVDVKAVPSKPNTSADPVLNLKIETLKAEQDALQGNIEAFELQKATIIRFADAGSDALKSETKIADSAEWSKSWAILSDGMQKVNEKLLNLRSHAKRLDAEILALMSVQSVGPQHVLPLYEAKISVDAVSALKANMSLIYQIREASWTPIYDARLTTEGLEKPKLEITRRAQIVQRTGEDWQDVTLQLSTVRLQRQTAAPNIVSTTLNLRDPVEFPDPQPALSAAPAGRMKSGLAQDAAKPKQEMLAASAPVAIAEVSAMVDTSAYQASFIVKDKVSLSKDGTQKTFVLGVQVIEPELSLKSAPSLNPTAYLEASFVHAEEAPLLAGQVMIHRDGAFVGRDALKLVISGDKAVLGFGADDAVKITRIPVKKRENDAGFWGNTRTDIQDFKTSVKNLHKFPVKITVVDRIPVSENTAITVEQLVTNTPPTEKIVDNKRGVMSWIYDLKPLETRDIRLGWRVKWPADRELLTSNRGG